MGKAAMKTACPCGGGDYAACCGRFIESGAVPQEAAQLMRSRYSAYVLQQEDYLRATWHPSTRPAEQLVSQEAGLKWLGLEVRRHAEAGDEATVEFVARYKQDGRAERMHEISRFLREAGRWYYLDGSFPNKA